MKRRYRTVRAYLEANGITQEQFARVLGISQAHLSEILSGRKRPSVAVALQIEAVTGVTVRQLIEGAA
jgi:transcriptional regulator with XRE-family HTH domain